jgi:hypothetical protein
MGIQAGDFHRIEALLDAMVAHQEPSGRFPSSGVMPGGSEPIWGSLLCDSHPILDVVVRFSRDQQPRVLSGLARMASDQPDPKDRDFALTSADLGLCRHQVLSSRLPAMAPSSDQKAVPHPTSRR